MCGSTTTSSSAGQKHEKHIMKEVLTKIWFWRCSPELHDPTPLTTRVSLPLFALLIQCSSPSEFKNKPKSPQPPPPMLRLSRPTCPRLGSPQLGSHTSSTDLEQEDSQSPMLPSSCGCHQAKQLRTGQLQQQNTNRDTEVALIFFFLLQKKPNPLLRALLYQKHQRQVTYPSTHTTTICSWHRLHRAGACYLREAERHRATSAWTFFLKYIKC